VQSKNETRDVEWLLREATRLEGLPEGVLTPEHLDQYAREGLLPPSYGRSGYSIGHLWRLRWLIQYFNGAFSDKSTSRPTVAEAKARISHMNDDQVRSFVKHDVIWLCSEAARLEGVPIDKVTPRKIRQYVSEQLLLPPDGKTQAARYTDSHLWRLRWLIRYKEVLFVSFSKKRHLAPDEARVRLASLSDNEVISQVNLQSTEASDKGRTVDLETIAYQIINEISRTMLSKPSIQTVAQILATSAPDKPQRTPLAIAETYLRKKLLELGINPDYSAAFSHFIGHSMWTAVNRSEDEYEQDLQQLNRSNQSNKFKDRVARRRLAESLLVWALMHRSDAVDERLISLNSTTGASFSKDVREMTSWITEHIGDLKVSCYKLKRAIEAETAGDFEAKMLGFIREQAPLTNDDIELLNNKEGDTSGEINATKEAISRFNRLDLDP